ncbi:unnamed protein product, partial [marine sediment metagenome]
LIEAGYRCANPTCRGIITIDVHHIVSVKKGGGNKPNNLLALCPNCHALVHREKISKRAIEAWKGLIVSLNNPNRASADVLLALYDEQKRFGNDSQSKEHVAPQFRFSGDSLGFLAGLITSGLAEISRRFLGASMFGASHPTFEVRLTKKGMSLVTAWRDGDPEAIAATLSGGSHDGVKFGDSAKAEVIKEKGKSS